MPDDLWLKDTYRWSIQQADCLRRLRAGERVNDLDWDNVIEEIESVGRSQVDAVRSNLIQAVAHLIKARAWPADPSCRRWLADATTFLREAQDRFRPSMLTAVNLGTVYRRAQQRIRFDSFDLPPQPLPERADVPPECLLNEEFTIDQLDAALFPAD